MQELSPHDDEGPSRPLFLVTPGRISAAIHRSTWWAAVQRDLDIRTLDTCLILVSSLLICASVYVALRLVLSVVLPFLFASFVFFLAPSLPLVRAMPDPASSPVDVGAGDDSRSERAFAPLPNPSSSSSSVSGTCSDLPWVYKVTPFSGVGSFPAWKTAFLHAVRLNNFSPAVAAKVLAASLSDDALLEFLDLPAVVQGDHVAALTKLELAFSEPALASDLRFHSLRMLPHESVFSFARRLRQAFASAYPALLNTPASEVMLKQRFLQSLLSASVRQS